MLPLLSLNTEFFFWFVTVAILVVTVFFWHKFSIHNLRNVSARFSLVILIQCFALASMGVTINRSGEFYDSWSDLFGAQAQYQKIALSPATLSQINLKDLASATHTKGGSLIFRKVIKGAQSGISNVVYVVASPRIAKQLEGPFHSIGNNYQVIELFPGTPGVPQTWIGTLGGITTMENLENAGRIPPTIAVIPAINVEPGQDTECMNFAGGAHVETWITSDMKAFMLKFMGIDNRLWSSFGYSTGGWCAAEVAVLHQDQYSQGVSLAGYFNPLLPLGLSKREKNYLSNHYDLINHLIAGPRNTKIMIIASVKDRFANSAAQQFMKSALSLIPIKYVPIPIGGHNIGVWKPFVASGFLWISGANDSISPASPAPQVSAPPASASGNPK
jgi:hypothetical protein